MRGRKPTASIIKLVTGNPGKRPPNASEAKPAVVVPEPPESLDAVALAEWQRVTPILAEVGLITKLDRAVIATYCTAWSRWVECERMLAFTGFIVKSPKGVPMFSPYLTGSYKAMDYLCRLAGEIGLSGSARSRIRAGDVPRGADAAEEFLSGRAR
jgi:P27 family predicted phage terminase small subunit